MPNIEMGKNYLTREGLPVRVLCVDGPNKNYPVVGFVGVGYAIMTWKVNGECNSGQLFDLVEEPEMLHIKGWIVSREYAKDPRDPETTKVWYSEFISHESGYKAVEHKLDCGWVLRSRVTTIDMKVPLT